ncbi:TPA: hypothetical protein IGZ61_004832 [Escherichia coli]|nr:hypothetical protein [Escherichia coli]
MDIHDVLAIPKTFTSNGVDFDYVRGEGDLEQIVNMYDGRVGLAVASTSRYDCQYYLDLVNKGGVHPDWHGSGKTVKAVYKIRRLPEAGVYDLSLPVDNYFTRRESDSRWVNMGSLSGYKTEKIVSSTYQVTAWCRVLNENIILDHKTMTPDVVNGHTVSSNIGLECGGGGKGVAKLTLSNGSDKSLVNLGNGVQSEVTVSESEISVAQDSSAKVTIFSKLVSSNDMVAGELNGSEILTVEWT